MSHFHKTSTWSESIALTSGSDSEMVSTIAESFDETNLVDTAEDELPLKRNKGVAQKMNK